MPYDPNRRLMTPDFQANQKLPEWQQIGEDDDGQEAAQAGQLVASLFGLLKKRIAGTGVKPPTPHMPAPDITVPEPPIPEPHIPEYGPRPSISTAQSGNSFKDVLGRRMAESARQDDEKTRPLSPGSDVEPTIALRPRTPEPSIDPGFTAGGASQAAFEQGRQLLRDKGYPVGNDLPEPPAPRSAFSRRFNQPLTSGGAANAPNPPSSPTPDSPTISLSRRSPLQRISLSPRVGNDLPEQGGYMGDDPQRERILNAMRDSINVGPEGSAAQPGNSFKDIFLRRMTANNPQQQEGNGQILTPANQEATRQRTVGPSFKQRLMQSETPSTAFGSSGEPFTPTRPRRTQPRDYIADDEQYLRDLENQPRNWKDKVIDVLDAGNAAFGNPPRTTLTRREREIAETTKRLGRDLTVQSKRSQIANDQASVYDKLNKPPAGSTRIADEGEYPDIPAGTEIRQVWNGREYVDDVGRDGRPRVSKSARAERAAAKEIKYNVRGEAVLVPKDGGPAMPIFNKDGTPLTKQANESGNVQTAYRLADDGITQFQIERDETTGQWVDSLGPGKQPIVRDRVSRIDPTTGAPVSTIITDNRLRNQQRQENERKRKSYEGEAGEWGGKESTFRKNKSAEDAAVQTKTAQLEALYQETAGGTFTNRGGRTKQEIETNKARLLKEIETHRANATHFQSEADKAASVATEARRNAGLHSDSEGAQGVIGRAPAKDGKHHYTSAEIRSQAEAAGVSYEALYGKLKGNKKVVIDE